MINSWSHLCKNHWKRKLRGCEFDSLSSLDGIVKSTNLSNKPDKLIWLGNGEYWKAKDVYKLISRDNIMNNFWHIIWHLKVPTRIKVFMWKLWRYILPVREILTNRGVIMGCSLCPFCTLADETIFHLFWECTSLRKCWSAIETWWGIQLPVQIQQENFYKTL